MAENINIDFMPNRNTPDIQRVTTVEDYLKLFTDRTKFCFASVYDDFADMGKRIEYLENYSIAMPSSVDLTVENAVILQEKESQQVIHNFTKTHYVKGNNVGYGGVGNSFVLGGYLAHSDNVYEPGKWYSEISFPKAKRRNTSYWGDLEENVAFYCRVVSISANATSFVVGHSINGVEAGHTSNFTSVGSFGLGLRFYNITAPDDEFEYGSADVYIDGYYETTSGYNSRYDYMFRLPFQSEAEYNAAIGLTNTPIELIKIQDFQYLVPESKLIVDKALSPDSDNVIANSTVAKALSLKVDKEAVETLSLVVESKADIIEVDALAEIVNSKADSTALTSHTGNTANPHNVTKNQIGLDKVENKSSADILSELQIGGTQILRNTQTTTLGVSDVNALWSEGAWRKASGSNGTWESIDIADCPEPSIKKGWKITSIGESTTTAQIITISQNAIPLMIGQEYTLSCYARGTGTLVLSATTGKNITVNNADWIKYYHTFTVQGTASQSVFIGVRYQGDALDICGMKLEKGSKATAWSPAPEDTTDEINAVEVGGTQILRGTNTTTTLGAASGGTMWETGSWRAASSTGSGVYRESIIITDAPNANIKLGWKLYGGVGLLDIAQDNVPIVSGNTYTLSCYARGSGILRLQYGKNPYTSKAYAVSGDIIWNRYSMTFVANETEGTVQSGRTNIYFGRASVAGDSIEICGMKLEKGNKATDWSPAPEDTETRITSLEERVSALEAAILSLGGET